MGKKIVRWLVVLLAFHPFSVASAQENPVPRTYVSGSQLRQLCATRGQSDDEARSIRALCQTYVLGVVDGHESAAVINRRTIRAFCLTEGIFNAELTDAVITWLNEHPASATDPAAFTVFLSLKTRFPCKGNSK